MGRACSHRCSGSNSALLTFLMSFGLACLFIWWVFFVCLLCFLVLLCCCFFPPLDAVLVGSEGDGKRSTMGTCREHRGTTTRGRSALPRLGSYSLMNLLVRNFTVSAAGGGGGWHGHPTEQRAVTGIPPHHPTLHLHAAVGPFTPLPICLPTPFPSPKAPFFPQILPTCPTAFPGLTFRELCCFLCTKKKAILGQTSMI